MAGIYIHVPFCKQACTYCDFHFSTNLRNKGKLVHSLRSEISQKAELLSDKKIQSIYYGGGTPSLLSIEEIRSLEDALRSHFDLSNLQEVTLEANPDDLSESMLSELLGQTSINRLSLGIQSFHPSDLTRMNRAHSADQALASLAIVKKLGFYSYTVDLIFALPWHDDSAYWKKNLETIASYEVPHLSCYQLTVEPKTTLAHQLNIGALNATPDERMVEEFYMTKDYLESLGYVHYEISNYARQGHQAVHNSNYWQAKQYLGIGPSAHSYLGGHRYHNIANNIKYIDAIDTENQAWQKEVLTTQNRWNEAILTGLRTTRGIDLNRLRQILPGRRQELYARVDDLIDRGQLETIAQDRYRLTRAGLIMADAIALELFV